MLSACRSTFLVLVSLFLFSHSSGQTLAPPADPKSEILAFNEKFINAHLRMDNPAIIAMWAEDGVSLLPSMAPMVGRAAIGKFITDISAQMPGYKIVREKIDFHDVQVSGDWASEWGLETQGLQPPNNQPAMEGYGKILFVLHKDAKGEWKIQQEMWNANPKP
jgi:ketosteroid isomerase-like protein